MPRTLPYVVYVEDNLYTCSQDTQGRMTQVIEEQHLNRVVVAACTPAPTSPCSRKPLVDAGLNKYLFEMANIRDQDSWVHMKRARGGHGKGQRPGAHGGGPGVAAQAHLEKPLTINQRAVAIGGGVAGLNAALATWAIRALRPLSWKRRSVGRQVRHIHKTIEGMDGGALSGRAHR